MSLTNLENNNSQTVCEVSRTDEVSYQHACSVWWQGTAIVGRYDRSRATINERWLCSTAESWLDVYCWMRLRFTNNLSAC